ncbi:hypothetical protein Back2_13600 [Nocardioides baekrokdamisoli]|uniref:Uncharacterized protein n=1 Tax=Nocardioides baekrokdamisoli TaxID=1804624 RepID=A0A3G9IXF1_9ACTN|nr:hypothetical protein [Nocardioides baekrokdamisoli]BBH17073.1 hypothetical protein Back2_13600 [Nocardioides baekrokdamisoli]
MAHALVTVAAKVVSRRIDDSYVVLDEGKLVAHHLTGEVADVWTDILAGEPIDLSAPAVAELHALGLIISGGIGRRTALKRAGVVVGLGITSLALPEAAAAASATSLNKATAGTYCVTVPAGQTTASFTITAGGGGAGGLTGLLGGNGGGGAKLSGTISGLVGGDVVVVVVGAGGSGGFAAIAGSGGSGYDSGGNGAAALTGGGGGGGGATSIGVVRGAAPGSCPANQTWSGAAPTTLGVAGAGAGGGSTGTLNGGNGGTTNVGSTAAAGQNGKNGGLLNLFGGGGGGGGAGSPAPGGVGGGATGGSSGWANGGAWTISVVSATTVANGGQDLLIGIGGTGSPGAGIVTFP